jgi:hypothetical protein
MRVSFRQSPVQTFRRHAELQENLTEIQLRAIAGNPAVAEFKQAHGKGHTFESCRVRQISTIKNQTANAH